MTGTSFAAPFVTGSAALLMQWGIVDGNDPLSLERTDRSGTHCRDTRRRYLRLLWHPCGDNRGSRSDQTAYYDQL